MPTKTLKLDAARIDRLRIQKGWPLDRLARRTGVSNRTIDSVMAGKGVLISTAKKLADALDVTVESILAEAEAVHEASAAASPVERAVEVTFRVGFRGADGQPAATPFEEFDEATDLFAFLDRLRQLVAAGGSRLQTATVFEERPRRGEGFFPSHKDLDWEGCAVVVLLVSETEADAFKSLDMDGQYALGGFLSGEMSPHRRRG